MQVQYHADEVANSDTGVLHCAPEDGVVQDEEPLDDVQYVCLHSLRYPWCPSIKVEEACFKSNPELIVMAESLYFFHVFITVRNFGEDEKSRGRVKRPLDIKFLYQRDHEVYIVVGQEAAVTFHHVLRKASYKTAPEKVDAGHCHRKLVVLRELRHLPLFEAGFGF